MDPILALARQHDIKVIEDCAQAQGAMYKNRVVGSIGDMAAFSFCQDKIMTTCGEGGMLTTNDRNLWKRAWSFKDHGKNYEATSGAQPSGAFRWVHDEIGTNWRMTEVQSGVGRTLLLRIPEMIEKRRHLAALLTQRFAKIAAFRVTVPPPDVSHAYYKYYVFIRPERLREGWSQMKILQAINAEGFRALREAAAKSILKRHLNICAQTPADTWRGNWVKTV